MNDAASAYALEDGLAYTDGKPMRIMPEEVVHRVDHLAHRIRDKQGAEAALAYYRSFDSMTTILADQRSELRRAWYRNFRFMQNATMYIFVGKALALLNDLPFPITETYGFAALEAASEGEALLMTPELMRGIFIEWNADGVNKHLMYKGFL